MPLAPKKRLWVRKPTRKSGTSRSGKNTKIHTVVDALDNPVKLLFTGGNISDCTVATDVLFPVDISGSIVMGDKA